MTGPKLTGNKKRKPRGIARKLRKKWEGMTEEDEEEYREYREAQNKCSRAWKARLTPEDLSKIRAASAAKKRAQRAAQQDQMTPEEKAKQAAIRNERNRERWAQMTEEEKIEKKKYMSAYSRNIRSKKGDGLKMKQRIEAVAKDYSNNNVTARERINRNILILSRKGLTNPRYKIAITLMKTAFRDIRRMNDEIEHLRGKCKQTVAKAVKTTIKRHYSEKIKAGQTEIKTIPSILQPETNAGNQIDQHIENTFACVFCSSKYVTQLGLIIHQKRHDTPDSNFNCFTCNEEFTNYNAMKNHYIQTHSVESPPEEIVDEELERSFRELFFLDFRKCSVCFKSFFNIQSFSAHILANHADDPELFRWFTFPCSVCNKPFHTRKLLIIHWKDKCYDIWKTQKASGNTTGFDCEMCGLKFTHDEHLSNHKKLLHYDKPAEEGDQSLHCKDCAKSFASKADLTTHMQVVHTDRVCCEYCGKYSLNQQNLKAHQRNVHFAEKKYQCTICTKRYFCLANLDAHLNTHKGLKSFPCRFCDKKYSSLSARVAHELVHKGGVACKNCGKTFQDYIELRGHKKLNCNGSSYLEDGKSLHDQAREESFTCKVCGKTYKKYMSLYQHEREKHSHHPFKCDVCEKTFKTLYFLEDHKYTHINIHRFGCSLCEKTFRQKTQFYDHRKKHTDIKAKLIKFPVSPPTTADVYGRDVIPSVHTSDYQKSVHQPTVLPEMIDPNENMEFHCSSHDFRIHEKAKSVKRLISLDTPESEHFTRKDNLTFPSVNLNCHNVNTEFPDESIVSAASISSSFIDFSRANVPAESKLADYSWKFESSAEVKPSDVTTSSAESKSYIPKFDITNSLEIKVKVEPKTILNESDDNEYYYENDSVHSDVSIKKEIAVDLTMDTFLPKRSKLSKIKRRKHLLTKRSNSSKNTSGKIENPKKRTKISTMKKSTRVKNNISISTDFKIQEVINTDSTEKVKKAPYTYPCKHCETVCYSIKEFDTHCVKEHSETKCFQCKNCELAFRTSGLLYKHNARIHLGRKDKRPPKKIRDPNQEKDFCCELCGKSFYSRGLLRKHFLNVHDERKFPCDVCGKLFNSVSNLNGHKIRHTDDRRYACEECGKSFFSSSDLRGHVDCVHRKIYRKKGNKLKLQNEKKSKNKEKEINISHEDESVKCPFLCGVCSITFTSEGGLKKHMALHDPTRQFACDQCGLRYKFRSNVVTHKTYVHNVKYVATEIEIL